MMNRHLSRVVGSVVLSVAWIFCANEAGASRKPIALPHQPPAEWTGDQALRWALERKALRPEGRSLADPDEQKLQPVVDATKRLYAWFEAINQTRDAAHKISLTSAATQPGYPIESPRIYNLQIILDLFAETRAAAPEAITKALFAGGPLNPEPGISDEALVSWGLKLDRVYALVGRWLGYKDYLGEMAEYRQRDVRGYLVLSQDAALEGKLKNWESLPSEQKSVLTLSLVGICMNVLGLHADCEGKVTAATHENTLLSIWTTFRAGAKENHDSFFQIQWPRKDVTWKVSNASTLSIPFVDTNEARLNSFLTDNIQDEYRFGAWGLKLQFVPPTPDTAFMVFEAGVVPNVDGNKITMDANQPLEEYDSRWTIRHEFGHIMGWPDCYLEFYDSSISAIVNYQLDVSNLMCSRRGKFKPIHFEELKRVYFKEN